MTRNAIIFVLATVALVFLWIRLVDRFAPLPTAGPVASASAAAAPASPVSPVASVAAAGVPAASAAAPQLRAAAESRALVRTDLYDAVISSQGARFVSLKLRQERDDNGVAGLELVGTGDQPRYGAVELPGSSLDTADWQALPREAPAADGTQTVAFRAAIPGTALTATKTFTFPKAGRRIGVTVTLENHGAAPAALTQPLTLAWGPDLGGEGGGIGRIVRQGVVQLADRIERVKADKDLSVTDFPAPRWLALKNHYFVVALFPAEGSAWNRAEIRGLGAEHLEVALRADGLSVPARGAVSLAADLWAGPQAYPLLESVGQNFQGVVQFQSFKALQWLNPICVVLLHVLRWFHDVTGNWGWSIILLTVLVRAALFYPSMKSMVNMRHMQAKQSLLKPRLESLKKTYKDNPQKLNEETLKLYKEYGVNPLGGCLPMLVQIPVFFALYDTLSAAYELRGAGFLWHWTDLTASDPTYIFPLAMGVSMFAQQKLSPTAAGATEEQQQMQKTMLWMMPVMFTVMALMMKWPLGLMLYWTASNLMGVLQQLAVNRLVD